MLLKTVRDYSKRGDALSIPNLVDVQQAAYERFLQRSLPHDKRDPKMGLEALLREVFPIESYDGNLHLEYVHYRVDEPRYTPDECRELRLTYGLPFKIRVRLVRKDVPEIPEEDIYLGEIPVMMGGGEYIINGAERVIVNQLHRSPGVDFSIASAEADRPLHSARIIPDRGSWIELEVSKKDVLQMRIDQSTKIPATTFLRAIDERYSTTDTLLRTFYDVQTIKTTQLKPEHYVAAPIIDTQTGEELVPIGAQVGEHIEQVLASKLKKVDIIANPGDLLILNTIADEKQTEIEGVTLTEYEAALLALYARLRPGNPPQVDKAKQLIAEKFFDENRYRLGKVGRFRINRKFDLDVDPGEMKLRADDFLQVIKYLLDLRSNRNKAHIDDIDHLGNRRLRTLDELAVEEMRKGFLKLKRTVQERMSVKDLDELSKVADLVNSKSISSAIDHFFGRGELSQVVDQTNPLSMLTHERRLSALGPGGLNRKRAGFEVRDVHISHYGRICPIETPEGTNIGLIASLGLYSRVDEYGFLQTPYRKVKNNKLTDEIVYLRADEEMKLTLGPTDAIGLDGSIKQGAVLARVDGDLAQVPSNQIDYVDISPKQIVGVSAALIPFLEHDDANRALMGSNMQRQAVPLIKVEPPCVATGMEKQIPTYSGMVVRARNAGTVTFVDAKQIVVDNADEYVLRKFVGLNERTCQNQKPIVRLGQKVTQGQIIADGASTQQGELALGKNVLVAFNTFDGYNFEDAIVISERLVKRDTFTSIHIEDFDVEIRETKLGREEFTCDIPNVSEKMLSMLDEHGIIRTGAYVKPSDILVGKVSPKSKSELTPEEKLLHAIFGRAGEDVKNDSLEVPAGTEGIVIGAKRFSRRMHLSDDQKKRLRHEMREYEASMDDRAAELFRQMVEQISEATGTAMVDPSTRQKVGASDITEVILEQIESFDLKWVKGNKEVKESGTSVYNQFWPRIQAIEKEKHRKLAHMKRGDELPSGVLEMVKVYIATKRPLSVGDKMAGRHGNKGVIARIVPEQDMPFLEDGTPVDVLLNPLGVPSRMNVGQILETHLGWACGVMGFQAVTPVFDGATEDEIHSVVEEANKYVSRRLEQHHSAGHYDELNEILKADIEEDYKRVLEIGFQRWLSSFKVVYTDEDEKLTEGELEKIEQALLAAYPDENRGSKISRFNRKQASVELSDERLKRLFSKCCQVIEGTDEQPWYPSTSESVDTVESRQGLYFFRNAITGRVSEGYIGIAGTSGSQMLKERIKIHLTSGPSANNFVKRFVEEAKFQLDDQKKNGRWQLHGPDELLAKMPYGGKIQLYDGRTGEPFDEKTTVGYMYIIKLHHLVDDKIHARATGPYSLITQQPLGGKARTGGQRFGEMEVWALEAYGAAYILQELLTVKSDDVEGRTKIYESMVKGTNSLEAGMPVAFDVLCNEVKGLGLNITLEKVELEGGSIL